MEIQDNWEQQLNCDGPFERWTGWSVFQIKDFPTPRDFPWDLGAEQQGEDEEGGGADERGNPRPEGSNGNQEGGASAASDGDRERGSGAEGDRAAGGSRWTSFEAEGIDKIAEEAAFKYIETIDGIEDQEDTTWRKVCKAGDQLLSSAGSVEKAAVALWIARERLGRHNLQGVDDPDMEGLLHPDHLAYLRDVRAQGMAARYEGQRERKSTVPHPRARENMQQVYRQLMKDVAKHRVLVVSAGHEGLAHTESSPFEAVPKMLPNRTVSAEVRLVHDQRGINSGTHKEFHPPALQPSHAQIVRRILFWKAYFPKVPVMLAKKDVAGAFRLLWLDPRDVELFAGDLPWQPQLMGTGGSWEKGDPPGLTMLFLVSSFGFSGSPGEWTAWGRGTEEMHRCFKPQQPRRDGEVNFDGKILVDDMVLVEPQVGLRPWVSSEVYEWAVRKVLGDQAINAQKDAEEGSFAEAQTVWGVIINARTEKMALPEARVLKGAYLLAEPQFNYGEMWLTLKDLQRFRGIATGWATVVRGLRNELKAADRFLGGLDGGARVRPSGCRDEAEEQQAWEDLWALFEDCRWLCTRSETWSEKFGGDIREMLSPMERLALPGKQYGGAVFVTSDATLDVLGAIDWTNGWACRQEIKELMPWIGQILAAENIGEDAKLAIHLGEMLSFVAFACRVGGSWTGKVVVYGGDNKTVYHWIANRKSGVRAGRLLIRVLNLVEMRYRCLVVGGWWRTYHNEEADAITRLPEEEVTKMISERGWTLVDLKNAINQALEDTERFGPCFLSWGDDEDRYEQMKLRELRRLRALHRLPGSLENLDIKEWTSQERLVKDFEYFGVAVADVKLAKVVAATIGPDPKGRVVRRFWQFLHEEEFDVAILEGPREVDWTLCGQLAEQAGWNYNVAEFLTPELGELLVRRRRAMFISKHIFTDEELAVWLVKEISPPSLGTVLDKGSRESWRPYVKWEQAHGQGDHPMLPKVGAHVWLEEGGPRVSVYKLHGPGRWPLTKEDAGVEELYVVDRAAPAGLVRKLTAEEVWRAQGRTRLEWEEIQKAVGEEQASKEGCRGTGRRTALALLGVAADLCMKDVDDGKAGMCADFEDARSLGTLLAWLRRWRRGDFGRAVPNRKAGGVGEERRVWWWGEELWINALDDEVPVPGGYKAGGGEESGSEIEVLSEKAGGRKKSSRAQVAEAQKVVELKPGLVADLDVQAQVEEWLQEHMDGDKAASTQKAYQAAWEKWCDWSRRQKWLTPYLDHRADPLENENKLLGYLGYMGWLGTSVASLKQAVFAIKDAHKRAGHGDTTGKMHRLWIILNSLERSAPKRPRRLGVTIPMLKWVSQKFAEGPAMGGQVRVDCRVMMAALLTAWFFMLRAREFCDSGGRSGLRRSDWSRTSSTLVWRSRTSSWRRSWQQRLDQTLKGVWCAGFGSFCMRKNSMWQFWRALAKSIGPCVASLQNKLVGTTTWRSSSPRSLGSCWCGGGGLCSSASTSSRTRSSQFGWSRRSLRLL